MVPGLKRDVRITSPEALLFLRVEATAHLEMSLNTLDTSLYIMVCVIIPTFNDVGGPQECNSRIFIKEDTSLSLQVAACFH